MTMFSFPAHAQNAQETGGPDPRTSPDQTAEMTRSFAESVVAVPPNPPQPTMTDPHHQQPDSRNEPDEVAVRQIANELWRGTQLQQQQFMGNNAPPRQAVSEVYVNFIILNCDLSPFSYEILQKTKNSK